MIHPSPALEATIRALHGETDPLSVRTAIGDAPLARVLALAPSADAVVRAMQRTAAN